MQEREQYGCRFRWYDGYFVAGALDEAGVQYLSSLTDIEPIYPTIVHWNGAYWVDRGEVIPAKIHRLLDGSVFMLTCGNKPRDL